MQKDISALLVNLKKGEKKFIDVLDFIDNRYQFSSTAFNNGTLHNAKGQNSGSCRVLAFGKLHRLNALDTLKLFAEHYQEVLDTPKGDNHQNIRQFITYGWRGVAFEGRPLNFHQKKRSKSFKK